MDFVHPYDKLTKNLYHNPNDMASLFELIDLYPQAKHTFDYEIVNSIELFVNDLGHNQNTRDFLTQKAQNAKDDQTKEDFTALLNGLFAVKINILSELETYQNYADIEKFFDFIIELKTSKNIELAFLINLLTQLASELNQDKLPYMILTDTLDYMADWYSLKSIVPNTPRANFIKNLKNNPDKKC